MKLEEINSMNLRGWTPLPAPVTVSVDQYLYKMPLRYDAVRDSYVLYVGDQWTRTLAPQDLPEEIKINLAAVRAYPAEYWATPEDDVATYRLYSNVNYPPEFDFIGWRVSISWYCIVVTRTLLLRLRGETGEMHGNTGVESQSESPQSVGWTRRVLFFPYVRRLWKLWRAGYRRLFTRAIHRHRV